VTRHTRFTADERNPPAACCDGKSAFETPQLAHHVNELRAKNKGKREVYRCPVCGLWHLGGPV
jgi:hypothetical protein